MIFFWVGTGVTPKTMAGGDFPMCASIAFPPGHLFFLVLSGERES